MQRFEMFVQLDSIAETAFAHVALEQNGPADDGRHRLVDDLDAVEVFGRFNVLKHLVATRAGLPTKTAKVRSCRRGVSVILKVKR